MNLYNFAFLLTLKPIPLPSLGKHFAGHFAKLLKYKFL